MEEQKMSRLLNFIRRVNTIHMVKSPKEFEKKYGQQVRFSDGKGKRPIGSNEVINKNNNKNKKPTYNYKSYARSIRQP